MRTLGLRPTAPASSSRSFETPVFLHHHLARQHLRRAPAPPAAQDGRYERQLGPPEAPLPGPEGPLPPPPPPTNPFPTRRDIALIVLLGSGAWWLRLRELEPDVVFRTTPNGTNYMVTPSGNTYILMLSDGPRRNLVMVDLAGNMFYDSGDRDQGMYIVDRELNLINAFVDPAGRPAMARIGNLKDLKRYTVKSVGDLNYDDGKVFWAFFDSKPLVVNPQAFVKPIPGTDDILIDYPKMVDEGVITLQKSSRRGLFSFFGGNDDLGGPLQRQTP